MKIRASQINLDLISKDTVVVPLLITIIVMASETTESYLATYFISIYHDKF